MTPMPFDFLPNLRDYSVESEPSNEYNCIAWAFGNNTLRWWPIVGYYWPRQKPTRAETTQDFVDAFASEGYVICSDGGLEDGYEKVAIYVKDGEPTHAARQLEDGYWTSKLGRLEDIVHATPEEVNCPLYGEASIFMRREKHAKET